MPAAASEESGALVEQDGLAMLCDRRLIDAPGAWLFDAQGWRARGAEAHAGGRDSVLYIDDAERHWVLRFYRRGGLPGKLVEQRYVWPGLWRTRPFREYRLLERLSEEGFPVPAPVAAGVWREGAAYRGALLMQRITGVTTLGERLRAEAEDQAQAARSRIEILEPIRITLPSTGLAPDRIVLRLTDVSLGHDPATPLLEHVDLLVEGPERIAITGPNGSGKTSLLATMAGTLPPLAGRINRPVRHAVLDQTAALLDPALSIANNLANANTVGFRAEIANAETRWIKGDTFDTRAQASEQVIAADMAQGAVTETGNPLDVAMNGDALLAVQSPDGQEAYTRRGDLKVTDSGLLTTGGIDQLQLVDLLRIGRIAALGHAPDAAILGDRHAVHLG